MIRVCTALPDVARTSFYRELRCDSRFDASKPIRHRALRVVYVLNTRERLLSQVEESLHVSRKLGIEPRLESDRHGMNDVPLMQRRPRATVR